MLVSFSARFPHPHLAPITNGIFFSIFFLRTNNFSFPWIAQNFATAPVGVPVRLEIQKPTLDFLGRLFKQDLCFCYSHTSLHTNQDTFTAFTRQLLTQSRFQPYGASGSILPPCHYPIANLFVPACLLVIVAELLPHSQFHD